VGEFIQKMKTVNSNSVLPDVENRPVHLSRGLSLALAIFFAVACLYGISQAWRAGASRLLTFHGKTSQLSVQTELAVYKTPADPEAHSGRALVLLNTGEIDGALTEYELAVAHRPRDYFLWLELGRARDMNNDGEGALKALEQSASLAPQYAEPHWQLGNVLFRAGRQEEAFKEMRLAAMSDLTLLPNLIDLSWGASNGDPLAVEQIIRPERASWRIALAKYFLKRGRPTEALAHFRLGGGVSAEDSQTLLNQFIAAGRYREAHEVWLEDTVDGASSLDGALLIDGGFENSISRANSGFGWQVPGDTQYLSVSLDPNIKVTGQQSIRLDFKGESNPLQSILTQMVLVDPDTAYRLSFQVRVDEIISGGLPFIVVTEPGKKEATALAQSAPFQQPSGEWQQYTIDLKTGKATSALLITLRRQNCSSSPCPIFGHLWLDDFILQKTQAK
jgi:thioredoxin-like negative regulator of GroEL